MPNGLFSKVPTCDALSALLVPYGTDCSGHVTTQELLVLREPHVALPARQTSHHATERLRRNVFDCWWATLAERHPTDRALVIACRTELGDSEPTTFLHAYATNSLYWSRLPIMPLTMRSICSIV